MGDEVLDLDVCAIHDAQGRLCQRMAHLVVATAQARLADSFEADRRRGRGGGRRRRPGEQAAEALSGAAATAGSEAEAVAAASGQARLDVQAVAASAEELAASVAEITRQVADGAAVARRAAAGGRATDATVQGPAQAARGSATWCG